MNKKQKIYNAIQWTWGLPQTLAGLAVYLAHRGCEHFDHNGAKVTVWDSDKGLSLGRYLFVPRSKSGAKNVRAGGNAAPGNKSAAGADAADSHLLDHEYGHSIQSLVLGPTYLILIGLPSFAWNHLGYFKDLRRRKGIDYDSAVFEKTATYLGGRKK